MGVGLNQALINGRSSLLARQQQMNVIGNNLSNANRADYHRQTANIQNGVVIKTAQGFFGTGVQVVNVTRSFDTALEESLRNAYSENGMNTLYADYLGKIEDSSTINGESPLQLAMQDFADAWQSVSSSPEDTGRRTELINKATKLKSQFNQQYTYLKNLRDEIADPVTGVGQIQQRVDKFNNLVQQLVQLNVNIANGESDKFRPQQANDLRDERDAVVKEISKLVPVEVTELTNRTYQLKVGGFTVVDGNRPETDALMPSPSIQFAMNGVGPDFSPQLILRTYTGSPAAPVPVLNTLYDTTTLPLPTDNLSGGEIKGCINSRDYVVNQMGELWDFAENVAYVVNTRLATGFDLNGNPPLPSPPGGGNLFNAAVAGSMTVGMSNPSFIAAASVEGAAGDGFNSLNVWNDLNTPVNSLDPLVFPAIPHAATDALMSHADQMANQVASDVSLAGEMADSSSGSVTMFVNSISERSGVTTDQELSSMLEVQRVYQGSAKYLSIVDSMMESVISMV